MEKFMMASGTALRVSDTMAGPDEKPVLVLLHGYLESLEVWDTIVPMLRDRVRIIAPDLPGHGVSDVSGPVHTMQFLAGVIKSVLDQLGVNRCFIAGHSMGGYAALAFLKEYPQMVNGIILFHSTPNADTEEKKENRLREIDIVMQGRKELLLKNVDNAFATPNRRRFADDIIDLHQMAEMNEDEGIIALLRGMMQRPDSNSLLRESSVPQLFIFGEQDQYIAPQTAREIADQNPQAKVVWLKNSGHMGLIEQPQEAASAILEFIEGHSPEETLGS